MNLLAFGSVRTAMAPRTWVKTLAIALELGLFSTSLARATPLFDRAPFLFYRTPLGTSAAVVADFNSDSQSDVAVACRGVSPTFAGSVSVFLGRADGTLVPAHDVPVAAGASFIATGDLDHDGALDLVTANTEANSISVLRGDGQGNFVAVSELPASSPRGVAVGRIDRDSHQDLVLATASGVVVLLGNGDGSFDAPLLSGSAATFLVLGDVDHNGDADVAATDGGPISILTGNGDGTFAAKSTYSRWCDPRSLAMADVNDDGHLDLAMTTFGLGCELHTATPESPLPPSGVSLYHGNGDGTFQWARGEGVRANGGYQTYVTSADLNHDGIADLAGAVDSYDYGHGVEVALGSERGTLQGLGFFATGTASSFVATGDVDGDGNKDLVTVVPAGIALLRGKGDGTFEKGRTTGARYEPTHFAVGDLNGDEFPDLAVALGTVELFFGAEDGNLVSGGAIDFGLGHAYDRIALVDLNLDGSADVVASLRSSPWNSGRVAVVRGDGHGSLGPPTFFESSGDSVPVGDQNGDGWTDVVVNGTAVAYGTGPDVVGPLQDFVGCGARTAIADFDGDGQEDVARINDGCSVAISGMTKIDTTTAFGVGQALIELVTADFDANGRPDIATISFGPREYSRGIITVLLNTLAGTPTAALVSLSRATFEDGRVRLEWYAPSVSAGRLYRSTEGQWNFVASLTADGSGRIVFEDREAIPGRRHGYRLGIVNGSEESFYGEASVEVPALALSLHGAVPNPAMARAPMVRFTLPSAQNATLEVFDLAGRRLLAKPVGALGPGSHSVDLSPSGKIRAGVHVVRLSQGAQSLSRKFVVLP